MQMNFLKLNDAKTEFLVMYSNKQHQQVTSCTIQIGEITAPASARNIGVIFDSKMNMKEHVNTTCKSCYCHRRNLGKVRHCLTQEATRTCGIHITQDRPYECPPLWYSQIFDEQASTIQNNAARIVTKSKRLDNITLILARLHCLLIEKRVEYKVLLTTFKAQYGLAPGSISDLISLLSPSTH